MRGQEGEVGGGTKHCEESGGGRVCSSYTPGYQGLAGVMWPLLWERGVRATAVSQERSPGQGEATHQAVVQATVNQALEIQNIRHVVTSAHS